MHSKITTTITTTIDLDTMKPTHEVDVEAEDELPEQVIYSAVAGACGSARRAALAHLGQSEGEPVSE